MTEPVILVENLSKVYRLGTFGYHTLKRDLARWAGSLFNAPPPGEDDEDDERIWALREVSFEVRRGEVLGIVGGNGAGKSTLVKILSRITAPSAGRALIHGRVGSLLEVGIGFHPELSGRENVFLNGAILGMKRQEIQANFDEIVAFADIGPFLDTPVKRYSSGMRVRLAFAVAAFLQPEILIIDEVLAVGDVAFQNKCIAKMREITSSGRTILLVSHSMRMLEALSHRALLLDRGRLVRYGDSAEVIRAYLEYSGSESDAVVDLRNHANRGAGMSGLLESARLSDLDSNTTNAFNMGQGFKVTIDFAQTSGVTHAGVGLLIEDGAGLRVASLNSEMLVGKLVHIGGGRTRAVECAVFDPPLLPGNYYLSFLLTGHGGKVIDRVDRALLLRVVERGPHGMSEIPYGRDGVLYLNAEMNLLPE